MARVVVIDDERLILELLRRGLKKAGHEVAVALTVDEGLSTIRHARPHAVVLDLEMPGKDGVACLMALRADPAFVQLPVLMISANPARDVILRVAKLGLQGIVLKDSRLVERVAGRVASLVGDHGVPRASEIPDGSPSTPKGVDPISVPAPVAAMTAAAVRFSGSRSPPAAATARPRTFSGPSEAEDADSLASSILQLDADDMDLERATGELKALRPLMSRAELMERAVAGSDLKAMGPSARSVLQLTSSSSSSIDAIAKAIKQDQALSLKVLRVANSPAYARGERIENVQKAVARIGVAEIRTTVMSLAVIDQFQSTSLAGRIKPDWFWEHSIATGLIASRIARARGVKPEECDSMFTAGLLHDVGRVIYAENLGDTYTAVIDTADRLGLPLETVESRLLIVNHADLTDKLLRQWNFSPELINPIALHHLSIGNIRRTAPRMIEQVATLGLANRLAHAMLLGCSGNDVVYPIEELVVALSLRPEHIAALCGEVPEQTGDLKIAMLSHGGNAAASLLEETRAALAAPAEAGPGRPGHGAEPLRPLYVALSPAADAAGILCRRLCEDDHTQRPNAAIVRINHARERSEVLTRLRAAEAGAGLKDLPTLVVATGAGCFLAPEAAGQRRLQQVVIPLRLGRLIKALRELRADGSTLSMAA